MPPAPEKGPLGIVPRPFFITHLFEHPNLQPFLDNLHIGGVFTPLRLSAHLHDLLKARYNGRIR